MKSKELRIFHKKLSELNNSFTHYNFMWEQFQIDYLNVENIEADSRLTTDVFTLNKVVETHRISMNKLNVEHLKTRSTLYEGIFLLIFTYFENYLKSIMNFAIQIDGSIPNLDTQIQDDKPDKILLDKILNRIGINKNDFEMEIIITIDYYRLKRNRLIHKNSNSISKSLREVIKTSGNRLNEFWNRRLPKNLQGINFSEMENANQINWTILIDSINSMKGITFEIDNLVIRKLTKRSIFNQLIMPEYLSILKGKSKSTPIEKLLSRFERYCMTEYGLAIDENMKNDIKSGVA